MMLSWSSESPEEGRAVSVKGFEDYGGEKRKKASGPGGRRKSRV
jgi:hypothetical protein